MTRVVWALAAAAVLALFQWLRSEPKCPECGRVGDVCRDCWEARQW